MKETLTIRNFGPIKDVTLDLKKVNVFIGESGSGKSTIVKVLAVCRYFSYIVEGDNYYEQFFQDGLKEWGLLEYYEDNTLIKYSCEHYSFEANVSKIETNSIDWETKIEEPFTYAYFQIKLIPKSIEFSTLYNQYLKLKKEELHKNPENLNWKPSYSFFTNDVNNVLANPFFIHTERNLQSYHSLSKNSLINLTDAIDIQFKKLVDITLKEFKGDIEIEPLKIFYRIIDGQSTIKFTKNSSNYFSLSYSASGYKMVTPIVLLMKYYRFKKNKIKSFIIEEPELSIFPSAQNELMKFFAENLHFTHSLYLTTHSPYILTSLNNLMYAYQVGQKHKDEVSKIIEEKYWVNPEDVRCYMMKDGVAELIMDSEDGLIKTDFIDSVSTKINEEFDSLLRIQLNEKVR